MSTFLTRMELSNAIRYVLSGTELRCAVAFWGNGAAELLTACGQECAQDAKIVCDVSMGSTSAIELERLGAPENCRLRFHDGLHAKVYISSAGAVVASANASSNGIGFKPGEHASLTEAGTFYAAGDADWANAACWFDELYDAAKQIDTDALSLARKRWSLSREVRRMSSVVRTGSLLDLVRSNPEAFDGVGFVFARNVNEEVSVRNAKKAAVSHYPTDPKEISNWPSGDMFVGWPGDDIDRWPMAFVEFWMPQKRLSIYARVVSHVERQTRTIFSERSWPTVRRMIKLTLPTAARIQTADADLTRQVLGNEDGVLFSTAFDLSRTLAELDPTR